MSYLMHWIFHATIVKFLAGLTQTHVHELGYLTFPFPTLFLLLWNGFLFLFLLLFFYLYLCYFILLDVRSYLIWLKRSVTLYTLNFFIFQRSWRTSNFLLSCTRSEVLCYQSHKSTLQNQTDPMKSDVFYIVHYCCTASIAKRSWSIYTWESMEMGFLSEVCIFST